ncbi:adenylate/guanylate cyclase domain-containing protein [Candidatus Riflebacteria bacterium]
MVKEQSELIQALQSPKQENWRPAINSSSKLPPAKALPLLLSCLDDPIWLKRKSAAESIVGLGETIVSSAIEYCHAAISEKNFDKIYWILHIIGHFTSESVDDFFQHIIKLEIPEFQHYVARAATIKINKKRTALLFELLERNDWETRRIVIDQLLIVGDPIIKDLEEKLCESPDSTSATYVEIYCQVAEERALPILKQLFSETDIELKFSIINSLKDIEHPEVYKFLFEILQNDHWHLKEQVYLGFCQKGKILVDFLLDSFKSQKLKAKKQSMSILIKILKEKTLPLLTKLLKSEKVDNRLLALVGLVELDTLKANEYFLTSFSDSSYLIRESASQYLARFNNIDFKALLKQYKNLSNEYRVPLLRGLGNIQGNLLIPDFIIHLQESSEPGELIFIFNVLRKIKPHHLLLEPAISYLSNPAWPVRQAAANCLIAWGEPVIPLVIDQLNSENEDIQFWSTKILNELYDRVIVFIKKNLGDSPGLESEQRSILTLLVLAGAKARSMLIRFLSSMSEERIARLQKSSFMFRSGILVENLMNLLMEDREKLVPIVVGMLAKIEKPELVKTVFMGLSHSNSKIRNYTLQIIRNVARLEAPQIKSIFGLLELESELDNILLCIEILANYPGAGLFDAVTKKISASNWRFNLRLARVLAAKKNSETLTFLKQNFEKLIKGVDESGLDSLTIFMLAVFKETPAEIIEKLSTPDPIIRMACFRTLATIGSGKLLEQVIPRIKIDEEVQVRREAILYLASHIFIDDFRIKGVVTNTLLSLGDCITGPLVEFIKTRENLLDRKAVADIIDAVGGSYEPELLTADASKKEKISDDRLNELLEKRKMAMEEIKTLEKSIITASSREQTIMFTDIAGYTSRSRESSLLDVMSFLKEHDTLLVPQIEKNGGQVVKFIGDAILATFENANKAVLSAIGIQKSLKEYNLNKDETEKLMVRVAINTGEVIVKEHDVLGDAVNVAARIEGAAAAGEIIISKDTLECLENGLFNVSFHKEFQAKGISENIPLHKVNY